MPVRAARSRATESCQFSSNFDATVVHVTVGRVGSNSGGHSEHSLQTLQALHSLESFVGAGTNLCLRHFDPFGRRSLRN